MLLIIEEMLSESPPRSTAPSLVLGSLEAVERRTKGNSSTRAGPQTSPKEAGSSPLAGALVSGSKALLGRSQQEDPTDSAEPSISPKKPSNTYSPKSAAGELVFGSKNVLGIASSNADRDDSSASEAPPQTIVKIDMNNVT